MSSFKGEFRYTRDAKGRINIPARFRRALSPEANETFVVIRGFDGCLFLFPLDEWKKYEEKLRQLPTNKEKNRRLLRMMTSKASEGRCDKQGRISIPAELLKIAHIEKEVLIIGVLERIELWNPDIYKRYLDSSGDSYEDIAEGIMFD